MTTTENLRYRGYEIVPRRQWSEWCASVYPTRADLPILSRSTLRTLRPSKKDAHLSRFFAGREAPGLTSLGRCPLFGLAILESKARSCAS
jgi:hypothetical protein